MRYTREEVKHQFEGWCNGTLGLDVLTRKQFNAMKRRTARAGFKKGAHHFQVSQKQPPAEYVASKRRYMKEWRRRRRYRNSLRIDPVAHYPTRRQPNS